MRLDRMGATHATRLSFLRILLRRAQREGWRVTRPVWALDAQGFGHAVYRGAHAAAAPTASSPSRRTCRRSSAPTG